jgi:hypothetical protein
MPKTQRRMHQTTVRFGKDLWEALEHEAELAGVSVAQFIREAAVARLGYSAAQRGDPLWAETMAPAIPQEVVEERLSALDDAAALTAESRQARLRSQTLRKERAAQRRARPH